MQLVNLEGKIVDGRWLRPLTDRGEGIQTGAVQTSDGVHFTVKIADTSASEPFSAHARVISKAYVEFVETVLYPISISTARETPVIGTLLNAEIMTARYREMFNQHVSDMQKAVVDPDPQTDPSDPLRSKIKIYCNGQPDSVDSILKQVESLAKTGVVNFYSHSNKLSFRNFYGKPLSEKYRSSTCGRVQDLILELQKSTGVPLQGVVMTSAGVKIFNEKSENPWFIQWQSQDAEMMREYTKAILSGFPVLTPDPFLKGFKKALEPICGSFQFLSATQLIELIFFRVLGKEMKDVSGLELYSSQEAKAHAPHSGRPAYSLHLLGEFLRLLKEGGIVITINQVLDLFQCCLTDPVQAQEVRQQALGQIPPNSVKQMRHYFLNCLHRCGCLGGYRLSPDALIHFNQPIFELIKSQTTPGIQLSTLILEWAFVLEKVLEVPPVIREGQPAGLLNRVQPALETLIQETAVKLRWSPVKLEKAIRLVRRLNSEILRDHEKICYRGHMLREFFILPALRLIPLKKIARLGQQRREDEVYQWLKRNREDLQALLDHLQVEFDWSQDYDRAFRWSVGTSPRVISYCMNTEMDASEATEEKLFEAFEEFLTRAKAYIDIPEIGWSQFGLDRSVQHLSKTLYSVTDGAVTCFYLSASGKSLMEKLFALIDHGSERRQRTLDMLEKEKTAGSSHTQGRVTRGKRHPQRGKGQPSRQPRAEGQIQPKTAVEAEQPPPISLQPLVSEDPLAVTYDTISLAMDRHASNLTNVYARQSWQNAIEIYKDLFAEFVDLPDFHQPTHVSNYVSRVVVLLSLLAEQVVSAYALENRKPTDLVGRHEVVDHNCLKMLPASGLENRLPGIKERLESVNSLEMLSRNLLTHRRKQSRGAELLYQADALTTESSRCSSDSTDQAERAASIMSATHDLLRDQVGLLGEILEAPLDLTPIRTLTVSGESTPQQQAADIEGILKKIGKIQHRLDQLLRMTVSGPSHRQSPQEYLQDASRLLRLIQARIERCSESGNVRNFFKELATSMALSLEFCVVTLAGRTGKLDPSKVTWSRSSHDLTNWFEKLGFYDLNPQEDAFLEACDRIHNLTRYSANYRSIQGRDSSQDFYLQLLKGLKRSDAMCPAGIGEAAWQSADRGLRNAAKAAVADSYERLELGLGLLSKVLDKLERCKR